MEQSNPPALVRLSEGLGPNAEDHGMPDEGAGLSWDGFNVRGDAQSVREVRRLVEFHAARSPERPNGQLTGQGGA